MEWNDLKYLLAVCRHETLAGAARQLDVDQTTVGRRLQTLEATLGSRLFDRVDRRWVPTQAGARALELALRVEADVLTASAEISGQDQSLCGQLRLTSVPMLINHVFAPKAGAFAQSHPGIELDLIGTSQSLDLRHLQADVAVRLARPKDPSAVVRRIATMGYSVYSAKRYARRHGEIPWLTFDQSLQEIPDARWVNRQLRGAKPMLRVSDFEAMARVVTNTPCRALLPAVVAGGIPGLVCVTGDEPVVKRDVWLVYMKAMRHNARLIAVRDWVIKTCADQRWS